VERPTRGRGEEADPPEIDAQNRDLVPRAEACAAEQRAVAAEGDQRVELDPDEAGDLAGPERLQALFGVELEAAIRRLHGNVLEHCLEVGVAGIADDADLHRGSRLSS